MVNVFIPSLFMVVSSSVRYTFQMRHEFKAFYEQLLDPARLCARPDGPPGDRLPRADQHGHQREAVLDARLHRDGRLALHVQDHGHLRGARVRLAAHAQEERGERHDAQRRRG